MAVFLKENQSNSAKRCKFLGSMLKEVFFNCHTCCWRHLSDLEEETTTTDFDDVQQIVVSMMRSRAMEAKIRRKRSMIKDGFSSVIHPKSGELFIRTSKEESKKEEEEDDDDDFASVQSHFSHCLSSAPADSEGFFSVKTNFSCCLSLKDAEFAENDWWVIEGLNSSELRRRAIVQQVCHCQGWPFGLCKRALLLPPLPKSPSDSWTWCKGTTKIVRTC